MKTNENTVYSTPKNGVAYSCQVASFTSIPTVHVDLERICHNYHVLERNSSHAKALPSDPFYAAPVLPPRFGGNIDEPFVWPSQLAVVKADAYGHGHVQVASALMQDGIRVFASGSVQEACALRKGLGNAESQSIIISLLGPITQSDLELCVHNGIIPLIHNLAQISMLESVETLLPIVIKCNTGMSRLGFDADEIPLLIESLCHLSHILPIMAISHLHSADTENAHNEICAQGTHFADMLHTLRAVWPHIAASLGNSAGTFLAEDIKKYIGPHICRIGITLYGVNPFYGTSLAHFGKDLLPAMWVSTPIMAVRNLAAQEGIGYGHTFKAKKDILVGVLACGYADGFSRNLSNCGSVCIKGKKIPLIGRVAMQMSLADMSVLQAEKDCLQGQKAWILGGPYDEALSAEELAQTWGTISNEVLCVLGFNTREYTSFSHKEVEVCNSAK